MKDAPVNRSLRALIFVAIAGVVMAAGKYPTAPIFQSIPALASQFYVMTSGNGGSDSADCLASTVTGGHGPCLTIRHAVQVAIQGQGGGGNACPTINIGAGTFPDGVTISGPTPCGGYVLYSQLKLVGSGGTTIIDDTGVFNQCGTITASGSGVNVLLSNMLLQYTGPCSGAGEIFAQDGAFVAVSANVGFGSNTGGQLLHSEANAMIEISSPISLFGNAIQAFAISTGGWIGVDGYTITCQGVTAFSQEFALVQSGGVLAIANPGNNTPFSSCGSVTGQKYSVQTLGQITTLNFTSSTPWTTFPGNTPGQSEWGGTFWPPAFPALDSCTNGVLQSGSTDEAIAVTFTGSNSACSLFFGNVKPTAPVATASATGTTVTVGATATVVTATGSFTNGQTLYILVHGTPAM